MISEELIIRPQIREFVRERTYGKYEVGPLEPGMGTTVGNALRRTLLNDILGAAITEVRIQGVPHEYTTIPGVREDVVEILLNLKEIAIRPAPEADPNETYQGTVSVRGEGEVTAENIVLPPGFEVANPAAPIATLTEADAQLDMQLTIRIGKGYLPVERISRSQLPLGTIPVDAVFSPVKKVAYTVEQMRVGVRSDYDRLVLEVWTNGGADPDQVIVEAAQILMEHFRLFLPLSLARPFVLQVLGLEEGSVPLPISSQSVQSLGLKQRTANILRRAGIRTIGDLISYSREELASRVANLGEQSLLEIEQRLAELGLKLSTEWSEQQ
ncbi:MAG: DNA-directed RNA polymerase subunit alpha [Armatimonadetes bacterium]|nr:DNA-directed RNA polymerase subunit alpha [Armatimonadota bacterium]MDW8121187.1 DNA-directed RNA polymerase subunit alpha [Armatimonadota bacterium]